MRGQDENQGFMFTYLSPEQRVPKSIVDPEIETVG